MSNWNNIKYGDVKKLRKYQVNSRIRNLARTVFSRANRGKIIFCEVCNYTTHVEICHIKDISSYDDNSTIGEINFIENLIALCPNHHWEFDNGYLELRGIRKKIPNTKNPILKTCQCGTKKNSQSQNCRSCAARICSKPRTNWPSKEELIKEIASTSYLAVGKRLGVSDNAVRKHLKNH